MKRNTKNKVKKIKVLAIILVVLAVIFLACYSYLHYKISQIKTTEISRDPKDLGINENIFKSNEDNNFINILLFGVDTRDIENNAGSADSIIILTVDKHNKKLKLTSIMRDTIVTMQGRGPMEGLNQDRINYSFNYGGAPLTIKTINENFDMNIKNYVKVDFMAMEKVIDRVGGININVKDNEIPVANNYIKEVAKIEKKTPTLIKKAGLQTLNGAQTVGYCRIRYVGNADFERTERQRKVLTEIFKKLSKSNLFDISSIANDILPNVETSLDKDEVISLASYIITNKITTVEQLRLPADDISYSVYVRNLYFIGWDKKANIDRLHKFIFEGETIEN